MILSDAYKNDILSKNTQLIPLVVIEKITSVEPAFHPFAEQINYKRLFLSTHNTQVEDYYFKPLLLNMPNLSQNLDLDKGRFQTSSLTLNISNVDYNNSKRISEVLDDYSLINAIVCIHYKTQSCNTIQIPNQNRFGLVSEDTDVSNGCPRMFTGVIRNITHQRDSLTLEIEDITDKTITRELPNNKLGDGEYVVNRYKNTHIPILYGSLENAPTVASYINGNLTYQADTEVINAVHGRKWDYENDIDSAWNYGHIKIHSGDQYLGVTQLAHWMPTVPVYAGMDLVVEAEASIEEPPYLINNLNKLQYTINDNNQVEFKSTSMLNAVDRVEVLGIGTPKNIVLTSNEGFEGEGLTIEHHSDHTNDDTFNFEGESQQHLTSNDVEILTDGSLNTSLEKSLSTALRWSSENMGIGIGESAHTLAVLYSLQWDSGIEGGSYIRVLNNKVNGIKIPVKGDANMPSGFGQWDNVFTALWGAGGPGYTTLLTTDQPGSHVDWQQIYYFNPDRVLDAWDQGGSSWFVPPLFLNDLISFGNDYLYNTIVAFWGGYPAHSNTVAMNYNPDADIKITFSQTADQWYNPVLEIWYDQYMPDIFPFVRFGSGSHCLPSAGSGWSSLEIAASILNYNGIHPDDTFQIGWDSDIQFNLDMKLKEIEVTTLAQFNDAKEEEFYLNAEGRTDTFLSSYEHFWEYDNTAIPVDNTEILENPADIIRHILTTECGLSNDQFDEDEFSLAWVSRQQQSNDFISSPIKLALSVNEAIDSKEVLQNISQNSMIYPRFKSDGKMGFITIQRAYYPEYGYNSANEIDINDIIQYKFGLNGELISKIDVSYGYDYGQKKNIKTTNPLQMTEQELTWNGMNSVEDNYLKYEADYIQDEQSAVSLRNMLWHDRKAKHLEIDLTLPLSYINLEIGDLCKFPMNKLIDGIMAHGINYTVFDNRGGVLRIPLFKVVKVIKGLDNIKVKLHQLHWLESQNIAIGEATGSLWESVGFEYLNNELIDPVYNSMWEGGEVLEEQPDDFSPYIDDYDIYGLNIIYTNPFDTLLLNSGHTEQYYVLKKDDSDSHWNPQVRLYTDDENNYLKEIYFGSWNSFRTSYDPSNPPPFYIQIYKKRLDINDSYDGIDPIINQENLPSNYSGSSTDRYYSLENINGTQFDPDSYDSEEEYRSSEVPRYLSAPDPSVLKLGWVCRRMDNNNLQGWYNPENNPDFFYPLYNFQGQNVNLLSSGGTGYSGSTPSQYSAPYSDGFGDYDYLLKIRFSNHDSFSSVYSLGYNLPIEGGIVTSGLNIIHPSGDVNLDGDFNVLDLVFVVAYIMGDTALTDEQLEIADLNDDSIVDLLDIVLMINMMGYSS